MKVNINETVKEVNKALKPLDLPSFRKKVTKTGRNVHWLLRNISVRNEVDDELINKLKLIVGK